MFFDPLPKPLGPASESPGPGVNTLSPVVFGVEAAVKLLIVENKNRRRAQRAEAYILLRDSRNGEARLRILVALNDGNINL